MLILTEIGQVCNGNSYYDYLQVMIEQDCSYSSYGKPNEERECGDLWNAQHVQYRAKYDSTGVTENHRQQAPVQHVPWYFLLYRNRSQPCRRLSAQGRRFDQSQGRLFLQRRSSFERAAHFVHSTPRLRGNCTVPAHRPGRSAKGYFVFVSRLFWLC